MSNTLEHVLERNRLQGRGFDERGAPRPLTPREFLEVSVELGATQEDPVYRALFAGLARWIRETLPVRSSLEIGCGPGYLLFCMNQLGIDAIGVDGNPHSRDFFVARHPAYAQRYRIDPRFEQAHAPADALIVIECFEHIPDDGLHALMRKVRDEIRPSFIVFSSTPHASPHPGWDVQWGHINVKPPEGWRALFAQYGFHLTAAKPPVTEWAALYVAESRLERNADVA
jgi:SAM-dependent methyltransferase